MMVLSIIFITATMNKNQRGSYDATRAGNRNNINIQINFNMKDKNQGFVGKKIDNYLEVEHKNTSKNDNYPKITEEIKKIKRSPMIPVSRWKKKRFLTPLSSKEILKITKWSNSIPPKPPRSETTRGEKKDRRAPIRN
jgi:hypothetical protein